MRGWGGGAPSNAVTCEFRRSVISTENERKTTTSLFENDTGQNLAILLFDASTRIDQRGVYSDLKWSIDTPGELWLGRDPLTTGGGDREDSTQTIIHPRVLHFQAG